MRRAKAAALVAAAGLAGLLLVGGVGAQSGGTATPKLDLSTAAAVQQHLASIGVDPSTVTIQRGLNNYAGPKCPGLGWNCTTATNVVQVAAAGGSNKFDCNPAFFTSDPPPFPGSLPGTNAMTNTCVIVQESESGQNHARCFERSTTVPTVTLTCIVRQSNETGKNFLQVNQQVDQSGSSGTQTADVIADVGQFNESGDNHVHVHQKIKQSLSGPTPHDQDGEFDTDIDQYNDFGDNYAYYSDFLNQDGRTTTTGRQKQNGDHDGDVFQEAKPSEGEGTILLQAQGGGVNHFNGSQSEQQTLVGVPGTVQTQVGPMDCCATQVGSPKSSVKIDQSSVQSANQEETANQELEIFGQFRTEGSGRIHHRARNNVDATSGSVSGTGFQALTSLCTNDGGVGDCETFEPGAD